MPSILIVEDEKTIVDMLVFNLKREGFDTSAAYDGPTGLEMALSGKYDLILLDVMLPGLDGFELLRRLREKSDVPVIMVTAREEERDKILGLETGADDYVTKPFSVLELTARVDALVRRLGLHSFTTETIQSGEFCLDMRARELKKNGKRVDLTQVEFSLMKTFLENRGRAMDREELLGAVWGKHYSGELKIVDVNIRRLRIKVEDDPASPRHITTVRGFGYMWKD